MLYPNDDSRETKRGDVIGEMCLILPKRRATVKAMEFCEFWVLTKQDLNKSLREQFPKAWRHLYRAIQEIIWHENNLSKTLAKSKKENQKNKTNNNNNNKNQKDENENENETKTSSSSDSETDNNNNTRKLKQYAEFSVDLDAYQSRIAKQKREWRENARRGSRSRSASRSKSSAVAAANNENFHMYGADDYEITPHEVEGANSKVTELEEIEHMATFRMSGSRIELQSITNMSSVGSNSDGVIGREDVSINIGNISDASRQLSLRQQQAQSMSNGSEKDHDHKKNNNHKLQSSINKLMGKDKHHKHDKRRKSKDEKEAERKERQREAEIERMKKDNAKYNEKALDREAAFLEDKGVDMNAVECMDVREEVNVTTTDGVIVTSGSGSKQGSSSGSSSDNVDANDTIGGNGNHEEGTPGLARTEAKAKEELEINGDEVDDAVGAPMLENAVGPIHIVSGKPDADSDDSRKAFVD